MTGEGGVAGEGKRVRVGAACAAHSCLHIARSVVGRGAVYSENSLEFSILVKCCTSSDTIQTM